MGFAYRPGDVSEWPTRFVNPNPNVKTVCYAQARVFNPTTWDLFTQNWHLKLVRVDRWLETLQNIQSGAPSYPGTVVDQLDSEHRAPVVEMMQNYQPEFVEGVTH